jgi:hypothetical protein
MMTVSHSPINGRLHPPTAPSTTHPPIHASTTERDAYLDKGLLIVLLALVHLLVLFLDVVLVVLGLDGRVA